MFKSNRIITHVICIGAYLLSLQNMVLPILIFLQKVELAAIMRFASTEIVTTSKSAIAITFPKPVIPHFGL